MLTALLDDNELALFQNRYHQARQQFLHCANQVPRLLFCDAHEIPAQAPDGSALYTDCAWIGSDGASKVLVLMSATHGVEGFAGSAIQADFLQQLSRGTWALPDDTAVLVVHALNPWGMAWLRRCDQQGIDLNRNFVDFNAALPDNPGYHQLRDCLMHDDEQLRQAQLQRYGHEHGQAALEIAISGGQHEDPAGPFFGGTGPAFARQLVESLINDYVLGNRRLAVIDLHTGLGPYGYGEVICDHAPASAGAATAQQWYGDSVTLPLAGTSSSVPKTGLLDFAWHRIMDQRSCFVTLEFGTYSVDALFDCLLADHRLHAHQDVDWRAPQTGVVKQRMLHHFCPDDQQWRELVLLRARQVIRLALEGLTR